MPHIPHTAPPAPPAAIHNDAAFAQYDLAITGLSHDGRGMARLPDGIAAFVSGALPGQRVRATITKRKKSWAEGYCDAIIEAAPDAVPPMCPHHTTCGGCPLQTMPYARQLACKEDMVRQALVRIGHLDVASVNEAYSGITPSPLLAGFRNKLTLAFGMGEDGTLCLGLRREGSHTVQPVPRCALLPQDDGGVWHKLAERLLQLARACDGENGTTFWRFCTLRRGRVVGSSQGSLQEGAWAWWLVCLTSPGSREQRRRVRRIGEGLLAEFPHLAGFVHEERRTRDMLAIGEKRVCVLGEASLGLPLLEQNYTLDATSFFQVNTEAAQHLVAQACAMLAPFQGQGFTLLDCYCGVGAPGLNVARGFASVLGVEAQAASVACAARNATSLGLAHCRYESGDAGRAVAAWGRALGGKNTVALCDPPRAGLGQKLLDALLALRPQAVLYISCNPATLARDAAILSRGGYVMRRLHLVDLFPHTMHTESIVLWTAWDTRLASHHAV